MISDQSISELDCGKVRKMTTKIFFSKEKVEILQKIELDFGGKRCQKNEF